MFEHVPDPNSVHHQAVVVAQHIEQALVVAWVVAAVRDHHHRHLGPGPPAVPDQVVVSELEGRRCESASGDPLQVLDCRLEGGHGVDVGVIETHGLKCAVVAELHDSDSCSYSGRQTREVYGVSFLMCTFGFRTCFVAT